MLWVASSFMFGCKQQRPPGANKNTLTIVVDTIINGFQFVKVEKGSFLFGPDNEMQNLPYTFYIMKFEVTNEQYFQYLQHQLRDKAVFVDKGKVYKQIKGIPNLPDSTYYIKVLNEAISYHGNSFELNPIFAKHPVISINWIGCADFCRFYGLSLPNMQEWQKAARGLNHWDFPWGNDIDSSYANYWGSNDPYEPGTTPVGYYNGSVYGTFKTHNAISAYGCYDMAGNAWEYLDNFMICKELGGAGGGFLYHTPAFLTVYSSNSLGLPYPTNIDRCDTMDGFRMVMRYE